MKYSLAYLMLFLGLTSFRLYANDDINRYMKKTKVRFEGEDKIYLVQFENYCEFSEELYKLYGSEMNVVHLNISVSKEVFLDGLEFQGVCKFPNQIYVINGAWFSAFNNRLYCSMTPEQIANQQKYLPGFWSAASQDSVRGRSYAGDCTYNKPQAYCQNLLAEKSDSIIGCEPIGERVNVSVRQPSGDIGIIAMTKKEIEDEAEWVKILNGVNSDLAYLQVGRNFCAVWSEKQGCAGFIALLFGPERISKIIGLGAVTSCYWIAGSCVSIIDIRIKDKDRLKEKLLKKQDEREEKAKTEGSIPQPSGVGGASASSGGPNSGPMNPPVAPFHEPVFEGSVTIHETPPGGVGGSSGSGGGGSKSHQ